jgi:Tol biopolymer transport system component
MRLATGDRLGPYQIVASLGAGGMGEVYRAHDTRLNRDVAIKVLPEGAAADPDRRSRLEREAQAVAALSHPNVLAVFDTGTHDGQLYVVTELLEGETLRARLAGGALPVRKALDVAIEIARGLAAAHDRQLVHRDLKPENIFLVADGRVKILDFGLARQLPSAGAAETVAATDAGTVLGTVGYMAPEQVRGQAVDARADLFAFGAVLYEMLTGHRAFRRDTAAETMTAILHQDPPDLLQGRADLPPALERIVRHCLEKSPGERFETARDVAFALGALSGSDATTAGTQVHGTLPPAPARRVPLWFAAVVGLAALAILGVWLAGGFGGGGGVASEPPIAIGAATQVTTEEGLEIDPALSPDGRFLAYAAGHARRMRIFIRAVGGGRTIPLSEGVDALESQPRWSPDGSQILYLSGDAIRVAPALGGASRVVAGGGVTSAAWSPDGTEILVVRDTTLSRVLLDGGTERPLGQADAPVYSCQWSPNGDWIACARGNEGAAVPGPRFGNIAPSAIVLMPAAGGAFVDLTGSSGLNESPVWSPDAGTLYFISNREGPRDIYVVRLSAAGRVEGEPQRVTTGLGALALALSASGEHLAYVTYLARANVWSLPIPSGVAVDASVARQVTTGNQVVEAVSVSGDGRWLLFDSTLHGNAEIFRLPIAGGTPERLTTDPADDFAPDLSPDGRLVTYHSWRSGTRDIVIKPLDGASVETVTSSPSMESYPLWSPDGSAIAFFDQVVERDELRGLFIVRRDGSGGWGPPSSLRKGTSRMAWLPDGQALACVRDGGIEVVSVESGEARAVYTPAPASADPRAIGVDVSDDGRTIYFKSHDEEGRAMLWSVAASGGRPRLLVQFMDPSHPSIRADFAAGAGQFFFTLEDRQADIVIADVVRRSR